MSWVVEWFRDTMGALFSRLSNLFDEFRNDPARILMVGLDAAGESHLRSTEKLVSWIMY